MNIDIDKINYTTRRKEITEEEKRAAESILNKKRSSSDERFLRMAEDTGLEPAGLLHLTRFPGELLSHSVNPPGIVLRLSARHLYNISKKNVLCNGKIQF